MATALRNLPGTIDSAQTDKLRIDLLGHLILADLRHGARYAEPAGARELQLRTDFEMQLEGERLPFVEVDVLHPRLPGGLDLLPLENLLVRLVEQAVERLLQVEDRREGNVLLGEQGHPLL